MAAEGAEERKPRVNPGKPTALKANNYFTQNNSRLNSTEDSIPPVREPFATFSRLNTSNKTYSLHSPARHLTHKKVKRLI